MRTTYKISLTPLGHYFFGGDMTFRVAEDTGYNEQYGSYIIQSSHFPQQTSLLGMLRFLLLKHENKAFDCANNKIINKEEAQKLIGEKGFCITNGYQPLEYGCIKQLYPCYLELDGHTPSLVAPLDYDYEVGFEVPPEPDKTNTDYIKKFLEAPQASINGKYLPIPEVRGYNPKAIKKTYYLTQTQIIEQNKLFTEDIRIGIIKNYKGKNEKEEDGFYKQTFYCLGNETYKGRLRFVFCADLENMNLTEYNGTIVNLGGDDSRFVFHAEECKEKSFATYTANCNGYQGNKKINVKYKVIYKIILLSDSYLPASDTAENTLWTYAISSTVPFRFLQTTVHTENYTILSKTNLRSEKYYLYEKGSVFFCDESQKAHLTAALETVNCFRQIGYNYFQILKLNPETNNYETI